LLGKTGAANLTSAAASASAEPSIRSTSTPTACPDIQARAGYTRPLRGRGGWSEANIKLSRYLSLNPGFSTDYPVDADIPIGGSTRNGAVNIAKRITPGGNFLVGADYLRWKTD
jgi:hypothetical protein